MIASRALDTNLALLDFWLLSAAGLNVERGLVYAGSHRLWQAPVGSCPAARSSPGVPTPEEPMNVHSAAAPQSRNFTVRVLKLDDFVPVVVGAFVAGQTDGPEGIFLEELHVASTTVAGRRGTQVGMKLIE